MKTQLKYAPLAILTVIVSAIALIGAYMIYSPLSSLVNAATSGSYSDMLGFSADSMGGASLLFVLGIAAIAVIAIILVVFFIYEERKLAIIISAIIGVIEFILSLRFFGNVVSTLTGGLGSIFMGYADSALSMMNSIVGNLQLTLIVILIGTVFNVVVLLQMYHVIHLSFLQPYIPSLTWNKVNTVQVEHSSQESNDGGESL